MLRTWTKLSKKWATAAFIGQLVSLGFISWLAYKQAIPTWISSCPNLDKALHFLLFGTLAFWVRKISVIRRPAENIRPGIGPNFGTLLLALADEFAQIFSAARSADLFDLAAGFLGILLFDWLGKWKSNGGGDIQPDQDILCRS